MRGKQPFSGAWCSHKLGRPCSAEDGFTLCVPSPGFPEEAAESAAEEGGFQQPPTGWIRRGLCLECRCGIGVAKPDQMPHKLSPRPPASPARGARRRGRVAALQRGQGTAPQPLSSGSCRETRQIFRRAEGRQHPEIPLGSCLQISAPGRAPRGRDVLGITGLREMGLKKLQGPPGHAVAAGTGCKRIPSQLRSSSGGNPGLSGEGRALHGGPGPGLHRGHSVTVSEAAHAPVVLQLLPRLAFCSRRLFSAVPCAPGGAGGGTAAQGTAAHLCTTARKAFPAQGSLRAIPRPTQGSHMSREELTSPQPSPDNPGFPPEELQSCEGMRLQPVPAATACPGGPWGCFYPIHVGFSVPHRRCPLCRVPWSCSPQAPGPSGAAPGCP